MTALVLDTETTGHNDEPHQFIEVAYGVIEELTLPLIPRRWVSKRFNAGVPSTLGAISTHHIHESELEGLPHPSTFVLPQCEYLVGHNIDFDHKILGFPEVRTICTLALARRVWPNLDSHKLSALVYHVDRDHAKEIVKDAHSALADVKSCTIVLQSLLLDMHFSGSWEDLWIEGVKARIPEVITFGKHKGTKVKDLPQSYKDWILRQPDMDPYLKMAVRGETYESLL